MAPARHRRRLLRRIPHLRQHEFQLQDHPDCTQALLSQQAAGEPVCLGTVETLSRGRPPTIPASAGDNTAFGEDTQRGYNQTAFFGSLDFDIIPKVLTLTAGTRWFQYKEYELGSVYTTGTGCENVLTCFASFPKHDLDAHNDHKTFAGFKSRIGLNWNVTDDIMAYYLFSEGFRPGGFNRYVADDSRTPRAVTNGLRPTASRPTPCTNQEIGIKSELLDHNFSSIFRPTTCAGTMCSSCSFSRR